jgi:hypothetical protein
LPKGERQPNPESVAATAANTANINLYVDDRRRRSATSTIINAPDRNSRGIDKESQPSTTTVTGSLLQKLVTLAAANLGSCDKNPGKADTKMNTGAIFRKKVGSSKRFHTRSDCTRSGRAGKHSKNWKNEKIGKFEKFNSATSIYLGQN